MTPDIPGQERVFFQRAWWGRKEQEPPEFPPTWDQLTAGDSILAPQPPLAQVKPRADLREGSVTPSSSTGGRRGRQNGPAAMLGCGQEP